MCTIGSRKRVAQQSRCSGADGGLWAGVRKKREKDNAEARRSLRYAEVAVRIRSIVVKKEG